MGTFCDIHNRDGKRAACGALRRSKQTIFSCVLIRRSSNDTYCHVVDSTTVCWCRQMDFCNADLEAELFDVEDVVDDSETDSGEQTVQTSSPEEDQRIIEATLEHIPVESRTISPDTPMSTVTTTNTPVTSTAEPKKLQTSTRRSVKTKVGPAIRMDVVHKIKLTPQQKELPPTVVAKAVFDSYEDELDDEYVNLLFCSFLTPKVSKIPEID